MDAIVIVAKAPIPSEVKTRLVPSLDHQTASNLYRNFLLDKIEQVMSIVGVRPFLAYTPEESKKHFFGIAPTGFTLIPQIGTDLGERLANIFGTLLNEGFRKIIVSDSDTPNLPPRMMRDALNRLDDCDVVIGPCEDGGFYLIGLKSNMSELFRKIPWSTSDVTKLTLKKCAEMKATVSLLDEWYDVDTFEALLRLKNDLDATSEIGFFCRNSYQALSKIDLKKYREKKTS